MHHVSLLSPVRRDRAPRRARAPMLLLALGLLVGTSAQAADLLDVSYRPLAGKGEVNLAKQYGGEANGSDARCQPLVRTAAVPLT